MNLKTCSTTTTIMVDSSTKTWLMFAFLTVRKILTFNWRIVQSTTTPTNLLISVLTQLFKSFRKKEKL
ncbi:unnamed protein product [Caenorhabditis nigoni]